MKWASKKMRVFAVVIPIVTIFAFSIDAMSRKHASSSIVIITVTTVTDQAKASGEATITYEHCGEMRTKTVRVAGQRTVAFYAGDVITKVVFYEESGFTIHGRRMRLHGNIYEFVFHVRDANTEAMCQP